MGRAINAPKAGTYEVLASSQDDLPERTVTASLAGTVNGQQVITNLDPFAAAGASTSRGLRART